MVINTFLTAVKNGIIILFKLVLGLACRMLGDVKLSARLPAISFIRLLLLYGCSLSLMAMPYQDIERLPSGQLLSPYLSYYIDKNSNQTIHNEPDFAWHPLTSDASFGYTHDTYWLKINLTNSSQKEVRIILDILYPVLDDVQVFHRTDNGHWEKYQLGDKYPFSQRLIENRHFIIPSIFPYNSKQEFVFRVKTSSTMQIPIVYWTEEDFYKNEQLDLIASGIFYGTMLTVALCNLFLFITIKDRHFIYYSLYISSISLFFASLQGLSFQYLWPNATEWNDKSILVSLGIATIFGNLFSINFLKLDRFKLFYYILIALAITTLINISLVESTEYNILIEYLLFISVITLSTILIAGIFCWIKGYSPARYFVIAWFMHILGGIFMSLNKFDLIPLNFITENTLPIGIALEALLLSFALADRFIHDKKAHATLQKMALELERKAHASDLRALKQERLTHKAQAEALQAQRQATTLLEQKVLERTQELQAANEQLSLLSITDGLTSLNNRRYLDDSLAKSHALSQRQGSVLAALIIDVDHFKQVNDNFGHQLGDEVLKTLARIIKSCIHRSTDICARYGGEEFAVVLPNTDAQGAMHIAEHIRHKAYEADFSHLHPELKLRVSIGVYAASASMHNKAQDWLKYADAALYQAKANGRNQVVLYELTPSP